jgi:hypothetical protein
MTAIAGIVDTYGNIYMGGDSAGTCDSGRQSLYGNEKVFFPVHGPCYLIGSAGSFRLQQVLHYVFQPPPPPDADVDLMGFMVNDFVDALRVCYEKAGILGRCDDGSEAGTVGTFMVGYQGRLFQVDSHFQVLEDRADYCAIGEEVAGALFASSGTPYDRVQIALSASARHNSMVREPFVVHRLPFAEDWNQVKRKRKRGKAK